MNTRLLGGGGGAFKGAFSRAIFRHRWEMSTTGTGGEKPYDGAFGTSVSALNLAMTIQEKHDILEAFWRDIHATNVLFRGIPGYLAPRIGEILAHYWTLSWAQEAFGWRWFPSLVDMPDSLFHIGEIRKKFEEHLDPKEFRCPLAIGIVNHSTGEHEVRVIDTNTPKDLAVDLMMATVSMAGLMNPSRRGGMDRYDGGHRHVMPPIPAEWMPVRMERLEVDFVLHQTIEPHPGKNNIAKVPTFLERLLWAIEQAMHVSVLEDYEDMVELAQEGAKIRAWLPDFDLGGMLDATRETIRFREEHGLKKLERFETL